MNRKSLGFMILALLLGVGVGTGGTIWAQKSIFKTHINSFVSRSNENRQLLSLGEVLVNIQGGAILRTTITLQVADAEAESFLKTEEAILKDRVNKVLLNRPIADVQTPENLNKLKDELKKQLNEVADNKITNVLFEKLVYQQ
jgi:flagellar FliL protein